MSIPPQLIRVKRKRVEETPVTFLQFDDGIKRHRSGSHWAYQRRDPRDVQAASPTSRRDVKPVIHVSQPTDAPPPASRTGPDGERVASASATPRPIARARSPTPNRANSKDDRSAERRRFHISRSMLASPQNQSTLTGIPKRARPGPAIFVERTRKRIAAKLAQNRLTTSQDRPENDDAQLSEEPDVPITIQPEPRPQKRPGTIAKPVGVQRDLPSPAPLPPSLVNRHNEHMDKIAADMNDWVLNEIGANLESIENERQKERQQAERARFRPKAPAQRYQERQQQPSAVPQGDEETDRAMTDLSEEEGEEGDWIIDEYVRIPVHTMALDIAPAEVGLLVLDNDEDSTLFFGPDHDDDDDMAEDDEDENAENYYTADYPEDEVESDDEYGRHAYDYRNANASDDEEFDNDAYDDAASDDMVVERGLDDDETMSRIRAYNSKRNAAFP